MAAVDVNETAIVIADEQKTNGSRKYLIGLFLCYVFGSAARTFYHEKILRIVTADILIPQSVSLMMRGLLPFFLVLFFAGSLYGRILIMLMFFTVGFSDSTAAMLLLKNGYTAEKIYALIAVPAALSLTALFSMGEIALSKTLALRRIYLRAEADHGPYVTAGRMIAGVLLITSAVFIRKYLMTYYL